jgi:hypothetical protein
MVSLVFRLLVLEVVFRVQLSVVRAVLLSVVAGWFPLGELGWVTRGREGRVVAIGGGHVRERWNPFEGHVMGRAGLATQEFLVVARAHEIIGMRRAGHG